MEAFSLLKYWRTSGAVKTTTGDTTKTILAAKSPDFSDGEDGPYIDLEFTQNDKKVEHEENEDEAEIECTTEEISENEFEEEDGGDDGDELKLSPSALFLESNLVSIEDSGISSNSLGENSKSPASLLKSATKFRVFLLKLKKSNSGNGIPEKSEEIEVSDGNEDLPNSKMKEKQGKVNGKFFTIKLKVEEIKVPLISLFTRDNSSKENNVNASKNDTEDSDSNSAKEAVQKYLKMMKPMYVRVSKRYLEKIKFSGNFSLPGGSSKGEDAVAPPCTEAEKGGEVVEPAPAASIVKGNQKQGNNNLFVGLKVVGKHLGKSRSASATAPPGKMTADRRDDSLVELQDGIQGAIMHCKKSFHAIY